MGHEICSLSSRNHLTGRICATCFAGTFFSMQALGSKANIQQRHSTGCMMTGTTWKDDMHIRAVRHYLSNCEQWGFISTTPFTWEQRRHRKTTGHCWQNKLRSCHCLCCTHCAWRKWRKRNGVVVRWCDCNEQHPAGEHGPEELPN